MVVLLRAIVMLVVLVGLPAAWVYYGPLPPAAQTVVDRAVELVKQAIDWGTTTEDAYPAPPAAPLSNSSPIPPVTSVATAPLATSAAPPVASGLDQQAKPLLDRLRALGATEYELEPWGGQGSFYRFRCAMRLTPSEELTRQFEAVTDNPLASIQQVVGEVTQWQMARGGHSQLH